MLALGLTTALQGDGNDRSACRRPRRGRFRSSARPKYRQFRAIVLSYLPHAILSRFTGRSSVGGSSTSDAGYLRDKLLALDADKGALAYLLCRALDARRAVEVGNLFRCLDDLSGRSAP